MSVGPGSFAARDFFVNTFAKFCCGGVEALSYTQSSHEVIQLVRIYISGFLVVCGELYVQRTWGEEETLRWELFTLDSFISSEELIFVLLSVNMTLDPPEMIRFEGR